MKRRQALPQEDKPVRITLELDIPAGWEFVGFRAPAKDEFYFHPDTLAVEQAVADHDSYKLVVKPARAFKSGDLVRLVTDLPNGLSAGRYGRVVGFRLDRPDVLVEFVSPFVGGHNGLKEQSFPDGKLRDSLRAAPGRGAYVLEADLTLVEPS